jgi:hypothetical protein
MEEFGIYYFRLTIDSCEVAGRGGVVLISQRGVPPPGEWRTSPPKERRASGGRGSPPTNVGANPAWGNEYRLMNKECRIWKARCFASSFAKASEDKALRMTEGGGVSVGGSDMCG